MLSLTATGIPAKGSEKSLGNEGTFWIDEIKALFESEDIYDSKSE